MKKIMIIAAATMLSAGIAQAEQNNVGCGLGSMVFNGKSGVAPQVLAATTNGTSGNQTFGISSGTLGCTQNGVVTSSAKLSMFTGSNMNRLARDMSVGHGEALDTMASLMGVPADKKGEFFTATQQNFNKIFASASVTADDVIKAVKDVMRNDQELAAYAA